MLVFSILIRYKRAQLIELKFCEDIPIKTLIIDNYDSFTYNIYQLVAKVNGCEPVVIKNDQLTWQTLLDGQFDNIIISPGPGHPANAEDFGICAQILAECELPILGICLGHQGIATVYGGFVSQAPEPMHGRICSITHDGSALFANIPSPFQVVRYHSLLVQEPLPAELTAIAWSSDGLIMGLKHITKSIWGVQFHPESICSEYGEQIFKNFKMLTQKRQVHPYQLLVKKIHKNLDTAALYQQYCQNIQSAIWLDSSLTKHAMSHYSIIGCLGGELSYHVQYDLTHNQLTITKGNDTQIISENIFDFLQREIKKYPFSDTTLPFDFRCGFVGYFGYELKQLTCSVVNRHQADYPDAQFIFLDRAIVYDHENHDCYLLHLCQDKHTTQTWFNATEQLILSCAPPTTTTINKNHSAWPDYRLERNQQQYLQDIQTCLQHIVQGDSYEVCLTNRIYLKQTISALAYYLTLRQINPAPYAAFLNFGQLNIASASIERFLKINPQGFVETKPIKGTLPRGTSTEQDLELIKTLKSSVKFTAENLMIVDLLRNDLGRVCEIGSINVAQLMQVESYQTVHQLVSTIQGQLKSDMTAIDCIKACFPGGSMVGAPKVRTLEIIDELEQSARGIYSGAIGYLSLNGAVDLNIVIRTAVITPDKLTIGVGGAVIALSDLVEEYEEILLKAKALLLATTL